MKWRLFYIALCSLLFAGIVHIIIIVLIPTFSTKDVAKNISESGEVSQVSLIEDSNQIAIQESDPFFRHAICRFDLANSALRISAERTDGFWSASIFSSSGDVIYSFTDRTAIANTLELLLVNSIQRADLRQSKPDLLETAILVESPTNKGFFLLRGLVEDETQLDSVIKFMKDIKCEEYATR